MEDVLKPMSLSQTALANAIGVPPRRINEIVLGKRAITPPTCGSHATLVCPKVSSSACKPTTN